MTSKLSAFAQRRDRKNPTLYYSLFLTQSLDPLPYYFSFNLYKKITACKITSHSSILARQNGRKNSFTLKFGSKLRTYLRQNLGESYHLRGDRVLNAELLLNGRVRIPLFILNHHENEVEIQIL